jgi:hypothetical protein
MKKTVLFLMALVMSAGVVFAQTTLKPSADVPGVYVYNEADGASWTGAVIALGSNTAVWPWSASSAVAFTPTQGATYRVAITLTSSGMNALRVRWTKGVGYGEHTSADAAAVSANVYTADQIADKVPAYFSPNVIASGETKTFTLDVTMDGSQAAEGLIGNIAFVGGAGSNAFTVDKILVTDAAGNQLVNYDANPPAGPVVLPPSATWPGVSVIAEADGNQQSGANIILGTGESVWPFGAAGADGLVAFTPVQGDVYRMVFSVESTGVTGFRVRWLTGTSGETYTADGDYVNAAAYTFAADAIADKVPAYFQNTISSGDIKTYTLDIPMGAERPFIGNLALRGQQGNNAFVVRTLQFFAPNGDMLVNYVREGVGGAIPQVKPNKNNAYGIEGGIVVKANENVSIFSFDGRLVKQAMGGQTIPMEKGLYIVKTATQADKVIVK